MRQAITLVLICFFVLAPAIGGVLRRPAPATYFMLAGSVAFIGVAGVLALRPAWAYGGTDQVPWLRLTVTVALGAALFVVGGEAWIIILALTAAACGSYTATVRPAILGGGVCAAAGLAVALWHSYGFGDTAVVIVVPPMAAFFAYTAGKRNEMVATLRQTRSAGITVMTGATADGTDRVRQLGGNLMAAPPRAAVSGFRSPSASGIQ